MCLRPDQLPIWTMKTETQSLDVLLLMASRMAYIFPDAYAAAKQYGSQILQELGENTLRYVRSDPNRNEGTRWFQVTGETLKEFRDKVRTDLCAERLAGKTKIILNSQTLLDSIERHIIPQQLIENSFLFEAYCDACGEGFMEAQPTRIRGMTVELTSNIERVGQSELQEIIDHLV
jgi:hypothetical protein